MGLANLIEIGGHGTGVGKIFVYFGRRVDVRYEPSFDDKVAHVNMPNSEQATMNEIDTKKNMAQLLREVPRLGQVLREMGIDCADCLASQVDTLEDVVRMYQLDFNQLLDKVHHPEKYREKSC